MNRGDYRSISDAFHLIKERKRRRFGIIFFFFLAFCYTLFIYIYIFCGAFIDDDNYMGRLQCANLAGSAKEAT